MRFVDGKLLAGDYVINNNFEIGPASLLNDELKAINRKEVSG